MVDFERTQPRRLYNDNLSAAAAATEHEEDDEEDDQKDDEEDHQDNDEEETKKMTKKTTKKKMKKTTKKKIGSNSSQITCGRLTSPLKGEVQPELAHTLRIRLSSCIFINIRMQHGHQTLCFDLLDMFLILYPGSVVTGNTPHHPHSRIKSRMLWFLFAVHNSRQTER